MSNDLQTARRGYCIGFWRQSTTILVAHLELGKTRLQALWSHLLTQRTVSELYTVEMLPEIWMVHVRGPGWVNFLFRRRTEPERILSLKMLKAQNIILFRVCHTAVVWPLFEEITAFHNISTYLPVYTVRLPRRCETLAASLSEH